MLDRKAAEQNSAEAITMLGTCYKNGKGVPASLEEAVRCFEKAADMGYVKARYALGVFRAEGTGVEQSYDEAFRLFFKAAA